MASLAGHSAARATVAPPMGSAQQAMSPATAPRPRTALTTPHPLGPLPGPPFGHPALVRLALRPRNSYEAFSANDASTTAGRCLDVFLTRGASRSATRRNR